MSKQTNISAFFHELRMSAGAIWLENGRIKFSAPKKFQNKETDDFISGNKGRLISILEENGINSSKKFLSTLIFKDNTQSHYALSPAQERLWFIEQFEEGTNAYHLPTVIELEPGADPEAIKYALKQIVARHEILRSTIEQGENLADGVQVVHHRELVIEELELRGEDDYDAVIRKDVNRPFNLKSEYPIRVVFYRIPVLDSLKTLVLINTHHIASDGWSIDVFQRELLAYYEAYLKGDLAFRLPELQIQYKDYAVWQKSYLTGEVLEKQLAFWKERLTGYQPLEFPADQVRPSTIDYKGHLERFEISTAISKDLRALAQKHGVTLFSVVLSSMAILLSKYTRQDDIVMGSPIANRHHKQTEDLIGFFVNTQVNRLKLRNGQSFEDLILQTYKEQTEGQDHQDLPFEKLVDELSSERDPTRHPICQVMLSVQSFGNQGPASAGKTIPFKPYQLKDAYEVERFDMSILINDSQEKLMGEISYATSLFHGDTIMRFIEHYKYLLEQLTLEPNKAYSQMGLLTEAHYNRVVYEWNNTDKKFPEDQTVQALFENQALKTPEQIALAYKEQKLSYRELNEKSNQLARYIRDQYQARTQLAFAPDTLVAVCMERCPEMVIAMLAVLKAGGAYVPLDPGYPQERVDFILKDTEADFILSKRQPNPAISVKLPGYRTLYVDSSEEFYRETERSNLPQQSKATNLAYLIYTSGTTGKPKGVELTHRNLNNLCHNIIDAFGITRATIASQLISMSFDGAVSEVFPTLISGAQLNIVPDEMKQSAELALYLGEKAISHLTIPADLLESLEWAALDTLKSIHVGGGVNTAQCLSKWSKGRKLINAYGPTECTVCTTMHSYQQGDGNTNIGKPFANMRVYVLDANKVPVPTGVIGELYIGGAGLAKDYLNRPELTAERFVTNPFATSADKAKGYTRLYKTGDLVRWQANGDLEYISRNDEQVKIRGYRIELGEIEYALSQIDGIRQVCVLARERKTENGSTKQLVAYAVWDRDATVLSTKEMESRLYETLPDYMIPGAFVAMSEFPLTVNGKLDRQALPAPDFSTAKGTYVAPLTETEKAVCEIWQDVLSMERVGMTDDFFRIGGNSILAIQVSYRMSRLLDCNVKVADIFKLKSIDQMMAYHDQYFEQVSQYQSEYLTELPDLIFIHPGGGGSEAYQGLSEMLSKDFNCIGIDNYNIHNKARIDSLPELAAHYLKGLEARYSLKEPVYLAGWSLGGKIALEMATILEARGYKNIRVILLDTINPDTHMKSFINKKYVEDAKAQAMEEANVKLEPSDIAYYEKVNAALEAETKIGKTDLSAILKETQVTLFKASLVDMFKVLEDPESKNEYVRNLKANNIDLVAEKVEVVKLDCYHDNILQSHARAISDYILSEEFRSSADKPVEQEMA